MQPLFDRIFQSRPDPLGVLETTAPVLQHARYVKIDADAIEHAADALAQRRVEPPAWNYDHHFFDGTARTVSYIFLLDTLNFCFWGKPKWTIEYRGKTLDGYWALAASLKRAAEADPRILDAAYLAQISPDDLAQILRGKGEIPLFIERWRNVRELGAVLRDRWDGEAARLVESAQGDAARLVALIADSFSSFNDVAIYQPLVSLRGAAKRRRSNLQTVKERHYSFGANKDISSVVRFLKRAQILVADLWGSFGGKQWGEFKNLDTLTAFADYKLPQILRAWGILKYAPTLARKIDSQIELAAGGAEELEIRAATLWAVEFLRASLAARGRHLMSVQVDWILWQASQSKFKGIKPHHRMRTIYY
jgi:putative queuosine salvage protein